MFYAIGQAESFQLLPTQQTRGHNKQNPLKSHNNNKKFVQSGLKLSSFLACLKSFAAV